MAKKQGLLGYASLLGLVGGGVAGAFVLGGLGLRAYFAAGEAPLGKPGDAKALLATLEGALVLWSFGVLSLVIALVSFVVLAKALSDDVERARRGPT